MSHSFLVGVGWGSFMYMYVCRLVRTCVGLLGVSEGEVGIRVRDK